MKKLNILIIPSWYPNKKDPLWGNYFIKQANSLNNYANVSMLYINRLGLREIKDLSNEKRTDGFEDKKYSFKFYKKTILNFKTLSLDFSFKNYAKAAYKAYKKLLLFIDKPDIIIVESVLPAGLAASYISKKEGIPYIIHAHSQNVMDNPFYKEYIDKIIKEANDYMAVNDNMAKEIIKRGRDNCHLVPNFINFDRFKINNKKNKDFTLINISNFYKVKSIDVLLKALRIVLDDKNNGSIKLKIVGTGEYKEFYESLANSLNLNSNVEFMGYMDGSKVPDILSNSDALCVSSSAETFCIPILEAFASGKPVITTNCDGPMEIVEPYNSIVVPIGNIEEYAKAIINMKNNYNKYNSNEIRENAKKKYDEKSVCLQIINICENVIGEKNET